LKVEFAFCKLVFLRRIARAWQTLEVLLQVFVQLASVSQFRKVSSLAIDFWLTLKVQFAFCELFFSPRFAGLNSLKRKIIASRDIYSSRFRRQINDWNALSNSISTVAVEITKWKLVIGSPLAHFVLIAWLEEGGRMCRGGWLWLREMAVFEGGCGCVIVGCVMEDVERRREEEKKSWARLYAIEESAKVIFAHGTKLGTAISFNRNPHSITAHTQFPLFRLKSFNYGAS
jgi:hypothetical protein